MHEFDKFVLSDIQDLFDSINSRQGRYPTNTAPNSPRYKALLYARTKAAKVLWDIKKSRQIKWLNPSDQKVAVERKLALANASKQLLKTPSKDMTKIRLRFFLIRYADDWIFFTNAKPVLAQLVKNKIASFLKDYLSLTLAPDKTKITDLTKERAKFLGFSISRLLGSKIRISRFGNQSRVTGNKANIGIDKDRVTSRFLWKGFMDTKDRPRELPALTILTDYEIVMRYNSIISGYVNYYASMIDLRSDLNYFVYILEYSCYKTLCHKHRTTIRKLIKKHAS